MTDPTEQDSREAPAERLREVADGVQSAIGASIGVVWWSVLLRGLVALAIGLCAAIWPTTSVTVLVRVIGVLFLLDALGAIVAAVRLAPRGGAIGHAIVSALIGIVLLAWPDATAQVLVIVVGVWAILVGIAQVIAAHRTELYTGRRGAPTVIGIVLALVGLVLIVWPGTGVVSLAWAIAIAAFVIAVLMFAIAVSLRRLQQRVANASLH